MEIINNDTYFARRLDRRHFNPAMNSVTVSPNKLKNYKPGASAFKLNPEVTAVSNWYQGDHSGGISDHGTCG